MGASSTSSRHGNMRQRPKIVKCKALTVKLAAQLSIPRCGTHCYCAIIFINSDVGWYRLKGDEIFCTVSDIIERMSCAQDFYFSVLSYNFLYPGYRCRVENVGCAVLKIAGPVEFFVHA